MQISKLQIKTQKYGGAHTTSDRQRATSRGFTLVELLVALVVMSIVLGAVATLAFAMGAANDATDDTSEKQAQVRYATLRLTELIRHSKLVCNTPGNNLAIWRADDNKDNEINPRELVYIEIGPGRNYIRFLDFDFPTAPNWPQPLSQVLSGITRIGLIFFCEERRTVLVGECSNVQFWPDDITPDSGFVSISFDIDENGVAHHYQINAALRGRAGHLLNETGNGLVSDDD